MLRAGIVGVVVLLAAGVTGWVIHHNRKPAPEPETQAWALPAAAGEQLTADLGAGKELLPESLRGGEPSEAGTENLPVARVGEIVIKGNVQTNPQAILEHLDLQPGNILFYSDLHTAEQKLAETGLFVVDPARGVRPTVEVVDGSSDSIYKSIVIRVQEK